MPATPVGDAYVPADRAGAHQETYPLDVWLCLDCGLAQLVDIVDPELLGPEVLRDDQQVHGALRGAAPDHAIHVVGVAMNDS